jgi:hypothetical protein
MALLPILPRPFDEYLTLTRIGEDQWEEKQGDWLLDHIINSTSSPRLGKTVWQYPGPLSSATISSMNLWLRTTSTGWLSDRVTGKSLTLCQGKTPYG